MCTNVFEAMMCRGEGGASGTALTVGIRQAGDGSLPQDAGGLIQRHAHDTRQPLLHRQAGL